VSILSIFDDVLAGKLGDYREQLTALVEQKNQDLQARL
jgi:5-(carboxyamino)imidazole ribonucleotide mutase